MAAMTAAIIIGSSIAAVSQVASSRMQSNASERAGEEQEAALDKSMEFEREQAKEDQRRYDETQARNREMYEQTRAEEQRRNDYARDLEAQRWNTEQARRTPYRALSVENANQLAAQTRRGSTLADMARR